MASKKEKVTRSPFGDPRRKTGKRGEDIAADFLLSHGFTIEERNWRTRVGEIDIIATKDGMYHFIEVKTRRSLSAGSPEESVTEQKLLRLETLAHAYLAPLGLINPAIQFGVVSIIVGSDGKATLRYFPSV